MSQNNCAGQEKWGGHKWRVVSEEKAEHSELPVTLHSVCHEFCLKSMAERAAGGIPFVPSIPAAPPHLLWLSI